MTGLEFFVGHYAYWFVVILLVLGLYGMIVKRNLVKKLIGMTIFQAAVIIFFISSAVKKEATIPIVDKVVGTAESGFYVNPLQHTLMLTAIVVGVATAGVGYALLVTIYRRYRTLNEPELMERMRREDEASEWEEEDA
ncbi:MAG: cation:proton antiporter subunit C [Acidobacteriota bacterium]|nr:cation:proton antiporter subunit C [Acidobacteriota bacterium]